MATIRFIFLSLVIFGIVHAYWTPYAENSAPTHITAKRYDHMFHSSGPFTVESWIIQPGDKFIPMEYLGHIQVASFTLFIKPGQKWMLAWLDRDRNWRYQAKGGRTIGTWYTSSTDQYVSGRFRGWLAKDLLISNPDGRYATFELDLTIDDNNGMLNYIFNFVTLQYASNANVQATDKLLAGYFDHTLVQKKEYVVLIKSTGYYVMTFNAVTNNWDILSSSSNGLINWWVINLSYDKCIVGGFETRSHDLLLCINPNGWHHLMKLDPATNTFQFIEGGSNGKVGTWTIGPYNRFLTGKFDLVQPVGGTDPQHLLAINLRGNSQTLKLVNNQWTQVATNNGDGKIAGWNIAWRDHYVKVESYDERRYRILALNNSGWWKSMQLA